MWTEFQTYCYKLNSCGDSNKWKRFVSPPDVTRKGDVMLLKSRAARACPATTPWQASLVDARHVLRPEFTLQHGTRLCVYRNRGFISVFTVEDAHNFTLLINYAAVNRTWRQLRFIRHVLLMEKMKCLFWISYRTQEEATSHTWPNAESAAWLPPAK